MADVLSVVNMIPALSSGETAQDSEPNLAVNPANPLELAATAFTPSPNGSSSKSPIFYSDDGGLTWALKDIIAGTPVRDQTLRFATTGGHLYAGVLWGGGSSIAAINFDILRTNDFSGLTTMTSLATRKNDDQPFVQAGTVPSGSDAGKDRVYVGSNDHAPSHIPATIDQSLDAAIAAAATTTHVIESRSVSRDGFQTRPAVHLDGTVYAVYYAALSDGSFDVVIVRDDSWGSGGSPFTALVDPGDSISGLRIATGVDNPFLSLFMGQQRMGGDLSIAVDPRDSATVYVVYGDRTGGTYTLYLRKSTDSGATWGGNLRTVTNATNPAVAIDSEGRLGLLYQEVTGLPTSQRWRTTIELTSNDFGSTTSYVLADTSASSPAKSFDPYLGDYLYLMTVGRTFYGIFSAGNTPDLANFPNGVTYQRNADFTTQTLLANDKVTKVAPSIDPFFFSVAPESGRVVTAIADAGEFGKVCLGSFTDQPLTIDNGGGSTLSITGITSSSPEFEPPGVLAYPMVLGPGDALEVPLRFRPTSPGVKVAVITVTSDDPAGPHELEVVGEATVPRLSLVLPDHGDFGAVCRGSFRDEDLVLDASGHCPVVIKAVSSSSGAFVVPEVLSYPLVVGPGSSLPIPIRFAPTGFGKASATISVFSNDPGSPHKVKVRGRAPGGRLAVTGLRCLGGVRACCSVDDPITLTNVGACPLRVKKVFLKGKHKHWKIVDNPFPATLAPGASLTVLLRYKATEKCPHPVRLVIVSDDPKRPKRKIRLRAYTIWTEPACEHGCDRCHSRCEPSCPTCSPGR